ncbi:MAG: tetratricopeptide repeat protein [Chloroflexi bacterium]|nr:tetratricopeptide repeat protein [Chloroflexota bacterium]
MPADRGKDIVNQSGQAPEKGDNLKDNSIEINNVEDIRNALEQGNLDCQKAEKVLDPLLEKNPGDVSLLQLKSRVLWSEGKFQEAIDTIDAILSKNPDNTDALAFKIQILLDHFKNDEAAKPLDRLMKLKPDEDPHKLLKARYLVNTGKYDEAELIARQLIKKNPDNFEPYLLVMDIYADTQRYDKGVNFIKEALKRDWPGPEAKSALTDRMGEFLERQGKGKEAVKYYEESLKINPDNVDARSKLASSMVEKADPVRMREEVNKALEKGIDDPDPLYALAQMNFNGGHITLGMAALYKAINMFPLEVEAHNKIGYFSLYFRHYREAQAAYARAKKLLPGNYDALMGEALIAIIRRDFKTADVILSKLKPPEYRMSEHYRRLGDAYMIHLRDYDKAAGYYEKSFEYMGQGQDPLMGLINLANIELANNRAGRAEKYFNEALEKMSGDIYLYTEIIYVALQNRRYDIAKKYIDRWEKAATGWDAITRCSFYMRFAQPCMINGDLDKAQVMVDTARKILPEVPDFGKLLLVRGETEKAKKAFGSVVKEFPDESDSWFYLGFMAEEEGDAKLARYYYGRAGGGFRSPGDFDYEKAWIYSIKREKEKAIKYLREACKKDIFNACRAYNDYAMDWMRDDPFFKKDLPVLISRVKEKTATPPSEVLVW